MKSFKKFLKESYLLRSESMEYDEDKYSTGPEDWYGDKFKGSPEAFEEHIKGILKSRKEVFEDPTNEWEDMDEWRSEITYHDNEIKYHLDNEHLTDEHFENVIPHLLNADYEGTIKNTDIPWKILKPQAELHLVAGGHGIRPHQMKGINKIFQQRDDHQEKMDKE